MRRLIFVSTLVAVFGVARWGAAAEKALQTLLVVPANQDVLSVGLDVGGRHPTTLLCYRETVTGGYALKGWDGSSWVDIAGEAYQKGTFFKESPDFTIIVAPSGQEVPEVLVPPETWCDEVYGVTTTETRPLIHLVGALYDFSSKDWKWFAKRYEQDVRSINPDNLNMPWYHRSLKENMEGSSRIATDDLNHLSVIRKPEVVTPVKELDEETAVVQEPLEELPTLGEDELLAEPSEPAGEELEEPEGNPLLQEAPLAVVKEASEVQKDD